MSWYDSHATPCSLVICRLGMTGWVNEKRCGVALFNFMEPSMTGRWASPSRQGFARLSLQNRLSPLGRPHRPERKIKVSVLSSFENHFNVSSFEILVTPPNWFVSTNTVSIGTLIPSLAGSDWKLIWKMCKVVSKPGQVLQQEEAF